MQLLTPLLHFRFTATAVHIMMKPLLQSAISSPAATEDTSMATLMLINCSGDVLMDCDGVALAIVLVKCVITRQCYDKSNLNTSLLSAMYISTHLQHIM